MIYEGAHLACANSATSPMALVVFLHCPISQAGLKPKSAPALGLSNINEIHHPASFVSSPDGRP